MGCMKTGWQDCRWPSTVGGWSLHRKVRWTIWWASSTNPAPRRSAVPGPKAEGRLRDFGALFVVPPAAGCTLAEVDLELPCAAGSGLCAGSRSDHDHDHDAAHGEVHIQYALDCAQPQALTGLVAMVVASLGERRRELAILRALGASPGQVFRLLALEILLLSLAGCLLGIMLLYAAVAAVSPWLRARYGLLLSAGCAKSGTARRWSSA